MANDKREGLGRTCRDRGGNESAGTEKKNAKRALEAISGRMMDIFHHRSQDRSVCDIC